MPDRSFTSIPEQSLGGFRTGHARAGRYFESLDCVVLLSTTALMPQLDHIKLQLAGLGSDFSVAWFYFAGLLFYALLRGAVLELIGQPMLVAAGVFGGVCCLYEFFLPPSRWDELFRFAQSITGGILIAAICRSRRAMHYALLGILINGLWLAIEIYTAAYDTLARAGSADFVEASNLRAHTMQSLAISANLNRLGFLCVEATIVAFAFGTFQRTCKGRIIYMALSLPCLLGVLLVQSRSALVTVLGVCTLLLLASHGRRLWILTTAVVIACIMWVITPGAAIGRFAAAPMRSTGEVNDARVRLYEAAWRAMPKYVLTGVGAGRFFDRWAVENGMQTDGRALGAHNAYLQILINWGVLGLALFLYFLWQAFRCLPQNWRTDTYAFALFGLSIAAAIRLAFAHDFYVKDFGMLAGLLLAGKVWIWPRQERGYANARRQTQSRGRLVPSSAIQTMRPAKSVRSTLPRSTDGSPRFS